MANSGPGVLILSSYTSPVIERAGSEQRQVQLTMSTGGDCQALSLGSPWTSVSALQCYLVCTDRFPDTCQSVVYNADTQSCTPGSTAFGRIETISSAIPSATSNDSVYYLSQPVPTCNTGLGFALYDVCGTSACLSLSASARTYTKAVDACDGMGSNLFRGYSEAKFALFWYVSLNTNQDTWIGLTDIASEGQFVWDNGDPLTAWQYGYIWMPFAGIPDNAYNDEHCVETKHQAWHGYRMLDIKILHL